MIHVSFDNVNNFIPRIPAQCCPNEDITIPRICVSNTITNALRSIPQAGEVLHNMKELGIPILIQVYYLKSNNTLTNEDILKYVPDAEATNESWILEAPSSSYHTTYEITDFLAPLRTDMFGVKEHRLLLADYKRVKRQDNWDNFNKIFSLSKEAIEDLNKIRLKTSFRTVLSNFPTDAFNDLNKLIEWGEYYD